MVISPQELALLRRAAENGNVEAQWQLGLLFANGQGLQLNYVEAAHWIEMAAQQGFTRAQSLMGWLHANGLGVRQDSAEAGRWYMLAAEQGSAKDQYMVATMYRFGRYGVERDMATMLEWYQKAADQGFAPAQYALGKLLVEGKHVEPDLETALRWLSIAHANGSTRAERLISEVMGRMSPADIEHFRGQMLTPNGQR